MSILLYSIASSTALLEVEAAAFEEKWSLWEMPAAPTEQILEDLLEMQARRVLWIGRHGLSTRYSSIDLPRQTS